MTEAANPPETLPAEFQDELVQVFCDLGVNGYISLLFDYPQQFDAARLGLAVRRVLDAEPVLGCRFEAEEGGKARWRRRDDIDTVALCPVVVSANLEEDTAVLLAELYDPRYSPNVRAVLIRQREGAADRLLLQVSHAAADGTASLDFAAAVAGMYTRLGQDPDYRLPPNNASRDSFLWLRSFSVRQRLRLLWEDLKDLPAALAPKRGLVSSRAAFLADSENQQPEFRLLRLDERRMAEIDRYASESGATLNDICLAAFFRAFDEYCPGPAGTSLEVVMPTNLRRYAPLQRRPAICNMSGTTHVRIGEAVGASFEDTLAKVCRETRRHKRRMLGTEGQMLVRWLAWMPYARKKDLLWKQLLRGLKNSVPPVLTQIGHTRGVRFACDGVAPVDLAVFGTPAPSPVFLTSLVRMDDRMCIGTCFDRRIGVHGVEAFLERMDRNLPGSPAATHVNPPIAEEMK